MNTSKVLVLNDDKIIEYKDATEVNAKSTAIELFKPKDRIAETKISLYKKFLERDEFKRAETKEVVLNEDEYLDCLEEIIQKEYYPDLYQLNKEKQISKKLEGARSVTGNRTNPDLDNLEKINQEYLNEFGVTKLVMKDKINMNGMSVDSFCMKYSSDELESLKDIIFKDKQRKLKKFFWMYEQEHRANESLKALKEYGEEYLALPTRHQHFKNPRKVVADADAKNSLFFHPDYSNTNNRSELNKIKLITGEGLDSTDINEFSINISLLKEKRVLRENTRLPENFMESIDEKYSHKMKKRIFEAYESSDVVKLLKELKEIDEQKQLDNAQLSTPSFNGYTLVKEPNPIPGEIDKIPIFTWGEIASTPNILKEGRELKFSVPQTPVREDLAHSLANKSVNARKKLKDDQTKLLKTYRSNSKTYNLTPSAMKLLNSVKRRSNNIFNESNQDRTPMIHNKTDELRKLSNSVLSIKSIKK